MLCWHDRRQHAYAFEDNMRMTVNNHELNDFKVNIHKNEIVKCAYDRHTQHVDACG
jgi:hypothetical protein